MRPILLLFDSPQPDMRTWLELALSKLGYEHQAIEMSNAAKVVSSDILQQAAESCALLAHITSSKSPIWSLIKQLRNSEAGVTLPIIGVLHLSTAVVGPRYEVWDQYYPLFTDVINVPIDPYVFITTINNVLGKSAGLEC